MKQERIRSKVVKRGAVLEQKASEVELLFGSLVQHEH